MVVTYNKEKRNPSAQCSTVLNKEEPGQRTKVPRVDIPAKNRRGNGCVPMPLANVSHGEVGTSSKSGDGKKKKRGWGARGE